MDTLKQDTYDMTQLLRKFATDDYARAERAVRDMLFLCLPKTAVNHYKNGAEQIADWFERGTFRHRHRDYPFKPSVFREAVDRLWVQPSFTAGRYTQTLNYLKEVMIGLLEQGEQRRSAAGVQVSAEEQTPQDAAEPLAARELSHDPAAAVLAWCKQMLAQIGSCAVPLPVAQKICAYYAEHPQDAPKNVRADLVHQVREDVKTAISPEVFDLECEAVIQEHEPFRQIWSPDVFRQTCDAVLWSRLRVRYRVPALAEYAHEEE